MTVSPYSNKSADQRARRARKFARQNGLCHWCKGQMTLEKGPTGKPPKNYASFEHLQRRRDGGAGKPHNVVLACCDCNSARDAGVQLSKPRPEHAAARRLHDQHLLWLAHNGRISKFEASELFRRRLVPNLPMWSKLMAAVPLGNP